MMQLLNEVTNACVCVKDGIYLCYFNNKYQTSAAITVRNI